MNHPQHPPLIPVAIVAGEVGVDTDTLAARLADAVELDAALIRCIPVTTARNLITAHHDTLAAAREQRQRRLAEWRARRRHPRRKGIPATPNSTAYADMVGADHR